jgi:hypothetical protein
MEIKFNSVAPMDKGISIYRKINVILGAPGGSGGMFPSAFIFFNLSLFIVIT